MNRFLIIPNYTREKTERLLHITEASLRKLDCTWETCNPETRRDAFDAVIFIGGDGTMLRSACTAMNMDIPLVGINSGHLGYYARISEDEIPEKLMKLRDHQYRIEECAVLTEDGTVPVINDVVAMVRNGVAGFLAVRRSGKEIYRTVSSGIILSTTIGSSAINRSAGGALLENGLELMEITPILPCRECTSSLVISMDEGIEVIWDRTPDIQFDGIPVPVHSTSLCIRKHEKKLKLISFD